MNTKTDSQPSDSAKAQQGDGGDCVSPLVLPSFTPGPWHCESSLGLVRSAADHRIIAAMPNALNKRAIKMRKPGDDAEITADARLIAAAPELLECLIHLADRDWFESGMTGEVICGLDAEKVRSALSKALGQNNQLTDA